MTNYRNRQQISGCQRLGTGEGQGGEGGVVIKDNRKGSCGGGLALYLDTSYTRDRVV